jgi:EmrB/QacA subfamily drug resistance transporter
MRELVPRHALVPLIVASALLMETLDSTVLATALPTIARAFGEEPVRLNLAITSYLFALAVFIPISGWVADRFGARRIFRLAIVVFTVGSICCGLSQTLTELVLARILQGVGGAMMVPVGRLVLLRSVEKSELVSAMTYLTVPALIGPMIGPPLGGFITTYLSWRWVFWINLPIGILGVWLVTRYIADIREERPPPLDFFGFILSGVGLMGLVVGFELLGRDILPTGTVLIFFAVGTMTLIAFAFHARRHAHPALDLTLLRIPTFRSAITGGFLLRIGIGAVPFLLPLMLQLGFGLSAFHSGLLTFVAAAGALLMKMTAAPILRRFGFRRVLLGNAILCGAMLASYGFFRPDTPAWLLMSVLLVSGYFRSLQFTGVNTICYADIPRERMSMATSFASMAQQLSLSIGVGAGALLLHLTVSARGSTEPQATDFTPAFVILGAISACAFFAHLPLTRDSGAEMLGPRATPSRAAALAVVRDNK